MMVVVVVVSMIALAEVVNNLLDPGEHPRKKHHQFLYLEHSLIIKSPFSVAQNAGEKLQRTTCPGYVPVEEKLTDFSDQGKSPARNSFTRVARKTWTVHRNHEEALEKDDHVLRKECDSMTRTTVRWTPEREEEKMAAENNMAQNSKGRAERSRSQLGHHRATGRGQGWVEELSCLVTAWAPWGDWPRTGLCGVAWLLGHSWGTVGRQAEDRAVWSGLVTGSQLGHRGETGQGQGCVEWLSYWVTAGAPWRD